MCGLVGLLSKKGKPVGQQIYNLYAQQKSRGKEGFGYLAIDGECNLVGIHRAKYEYDIRNQLMREKAEIILFHHRLPTSTRNTIGTTHPIFVSHNELDHDYYFAHNGVILNSDTLKKTHNALGYVYNTEFREYSHIVYNDGRTEDSVAGKDYYNDSESLAIELARYCDGITSEIKTTGGAAFWGIQLEKGTNHVKKIYYGKNSGRDLKMTRNKKYWGFSSETGSDIESMVLNVIDLREGEHYEKPLAIEDYVVRQKINYGYGSHWEPSKEPKKQELLAGVNNYLDLENKEYTREQALDTGVPLSEFFSEDKPYGRVFVPIKFAQQTSTRKMFMLGLPPAEIDKDVYKPSAKVLETAEDYCMKYVELERDKENLDSAYDTGHLDKHEYEKQVRKIENQMQEYEERLSALNLPEETIEEMYELCREFVDYNSTYPNYSDDVEYINIA